ncbi:MAG TPA: hypothetical protein DHV49_00800, partial [Alphaproteobacteria bacterium]|nr:hypothetical protein [Alphaproteobacteria bacterium]
MKFKDKLSKSDKKLLLEVCVIPSSVATQAIASSGVDAIVIDQEHGAISTDTLHSMIASTAGTDCAPIVRVAEKRAEYVKIALDMGAEGIMFPLIHNAQEAKECVSMINYPLNGQRGWGPFIAHSRWNVELMEYRQLYEKKIVCIILIETKEAVEDIVNICHVEGIDAIFVAKFDLSTSLGISGDFENDIFKAAIKTIEEVARKKNIPLGGGPLNTRTDCD